jgi:acetyl esterase
MVAQSEILGIDPARIVVGGDSAGGNLAAVLALMARDNQQPAVLAQLLIYPVTDQRQSFASYSSYGEDFGLTATAMAWYRNHYVPDRADWSDWHVAPLRAASLEGVAPAFVVLAGHDVLFDEGMAYVTRLTSEARATHQIWPGQIHGFVSMGLLIPEAREALNAVAKAWRDLDPSNNR